MVDCGERNVGERWGHHPRCLLQLRDLGRDPMITTYSQHIGEHEIWPRMLFPRPYETDTWVETFAVTGQGEGWREHAHHIRTPDGALRPLRFSHVARLEIVASDHDAPWALRVAHVDGVTDFDATRTSGRRLALGGELAAMVTF